MQKRLGQEWISIRPGYDYDAIDEDMRKAADAFDIEPVPEGTIIEERKMTEEKIMQVRELIGTVPVSIDYTAVDRPLELALFLLKHGFNVESVFVDVFTEAREVFEELRNMAPELKIYQSLGWNIRKMKRVHEGKLLAIGQKSAYFMNSSFFVNIIENEGMYGYRGIRRLMELMAEAFETEKPMSELVQIKGWGCGCS